MADALTALEQALEAERRALLDHDVEALLRSTERKVAAVRVLQGMPPAQLPAERVGALSEFNQANHVLLARRRREVSWTLRHLGRMDATGVYDASGQSGARPQARCLGAA
ncbi:hypothetical protein GCM10028862_19800 [Luteimonas pelagia]